MKYSERERHIAARFVDLFTESREAPLYHWMRTSKALMSFGNDRMEANWMHINPVSGKVMYGNSFSRNPVFDIGFPVRITIDQKKLSRTNRIIPVDGDNVFHFTNKIKNDPRISGLNDDEDDFDILSPDEMKELVSHGKQYDMEVIKKIRDRSKNIRTRHVARPTYSFDEEFVIGDIKNLHRYVQKIEIFPDYYRLFELPLDEDFFEVVREYAEKYKIPLKIGSSFKKRKDELIKNRKRKLQRMKKRLGEEREEKEIDPYDITNFELTDDELEERVIFWIFAIQNRASIASRATYKFMEIIGGFKHSPFDAIKRTFSGPEEIEEVLHGVGIGKTKQKATFVWSAANSGVNLRSDSPDKLQVCIKGFGPKTARCFVIHSRKAEQYAGLDTHILKWLRSIGFERIPTDTPQNTREYERIEEIFKREARMRNMTPAELDLKIWKSYTRKENLDEGRKVVKPVVAYHGTSSKFLPNIMKHGLIPDPSEKVWHSDFFESYGGVYLTNHEFRAMDAAEDAVERVGGNMVVIKVQITLPTTNLDEDRVLDIMSRVLRFAVVSGVNGLGERSFNEFSGSEQKKILDKLVNRFLHRQEGKVKVGTRETVRKLFNLILSTSTSDLLKMSSVAFLNAWYDKNPEHQKQFRMLVDKITQSAITPENYKTETTFRLKQRVGFRGRNRILSIKKAKNEITGREWNQVYPSQLREGRKVARPIIAYHGTSSTFLPNILKHGLQPFPKNLVWDKGYHKSYGGVYLTKSEVLAKRIAADTTEVERIGGEPIVLKVQVTLPSAQMDEDETLGQIQYALRMVLRHIDPNKATISEKHRELYAESVFKLLKGEMGPVIPIHVKDAIKEFSKMILATLDTRGDGHLFFSVREWYSKHPGYRREFRKLIDIITGTPVRKRGYKPGDGYKNATFRVVRPIGFRGKNRILDIKQYEWDDEKVDAVKVIYPPIGKEK